MVLKLSDRPIKKPGFTIRYSQVFKDKLLNKGPEIELKPQTNSQ